MCEKSTILNSIIGQVIALLTFFAFPAFQYIIVRRFSKTQGLPELWYLPAYGFRLVIRNIPNNRTLSDIKARTTLRRTIPANTNSSVSTFQDKIFLEIEEFFILPQSDKILLSFKIIGDSELNLELVQTDKLGNSIMVIPFGEIDELISDYSANVENLLNFDIKIMKRAVMTKSQLMDCWKAIRSSNIEQRLNCMQVFSIG